jgi:hypothetical protein
LGKHFADGIAEEIQAVTGKWISNPSNCPTTFICAAGKLDDPDLEPLWNQILKP